MLQVRLKPTEYTIIAILPIGKIGITANEKGSKIEPFFYSL